MAFVDLGGGHSMRSFHGLVLCACLLAPLAVVACGDDSSADDDDDSDSGDTLYARLGEEAGIETVIEDFVGRVLGDAKINGYFLNSNVDDDRLVDCLVKMVGNATGGPQTYPDPAAGCRDMATAHAGMGISTADFGDLVAHLVGALADAGVAQPDIDTITGVLGPLSSDIVEDEGNDQTVYQRVGRKPAIQTVVETFVEIVVADSRINGFFGGLTSTDRLITCLVRQVCSIDGPCGYGLEVEHPADPGVSELLVCRDMLTTHDALVDDVASPITYDDFSALVEDLVMALDDAGVATEDKDAILGVLGPMCLDIVADPTSCP
jgi:hemoglobin